MKRHILLSGLALAGVALGPAVAGADDEVRNDYPTAERVMFVEECMSDYPDKGRFEMVQKCSCVVDQFARHYTFDQFVDMSTAAKAFTIAGERGNVVRDTSMGQRLNADWKQAMAAAKENCFLK